MNDKTEHAKRNPYQAPEGYFEQLPYRLQQQLGSSNATELLPWFLKTKWQAALVLVLLVGTGLWLSLPKEQQPLQAETILSGLPEEAIISYVEEEVLASVSMADISADAPALEADDYLQSIDTESLYRELEEDVPVLTKEDLSL